MEPRKLYDEYIDLVGRTSPWVGDLRQDGSYGPAPVVSTADLLRREELHRILNENHAEWLRVNLNAADYFEFIKDW